MDLIVHGGAGSAPDEPTARQAVLDDAARAGSDAASPLDAVRDAVAVLESNPRFNAGVGSTVQSDGVVRTDASVMTDDGLAGAACAMPGVEHAVDVARAVATETPHVLLAGDRAVEFADAVGVETDADLWTDDTRERWQAADPPDGDAAEQLAWVRERFGASHDTVGAVATDGDRVAAATSTGGRWFALAGRVGDVPQLGAGVYADERGGASATGEGEAIARFGLAKEAVRALDRHDPSKAAQTAVDAFADAIGGRAGVIVLDRAGRVGAAENTDAMQTATR
ncbi:MULTISPECIES: isoaspartyl peptidase/L-asparaginase [Halomicrobium]|uniref:Plant-type L-asparaginase n=2 Tax=Halomicrobium mukohataei TaxID=57705 RepID=C7P3F0_HALMD|nr:MULTISPECIES: isoaspartyl peptidase/L-asparaginase [Halomicrobium]ACV47622.1 peptidase T2 asparaginase 2 [Halomicrobium mukohataei DSM 12286]QCD66080.1 asparaginase [Halomicrobium mukohataei]QFR20885.1 asparaginase [Halomicrobium sp. ZPS1]